MKYSAMNIEPIILCVDDEPGVLLYLERQLCRCCGCRVICVESGMDALRCLDQTVVDAVIVDLRLPDINGKELLSQVADRWPDITRILVTGSAAAMSSDIVGEHLSIQYLLDKPWKEQDLIRIVEAVGHKR